MKAKNNIIEPVKVTIDSRAMMRYDSEIRVINEQIATLGELLKENGKPHDNLSILSAIFVDGWIEGEEMKRLDGIIDPVVKSILREFIPQMPESFTEMVGFIRNRILGATVIVNDIATPLSLRETDFVNEGGVLMVSPEHRKRFEASITHELTPDEMKAYTVLAGAIPELKMLKSEGWSVIPLLEGRIGRYDFQEGVDGLEHLAEDVCKYRRVTTIK